MQLIKPNVTYEESFRSALAEFATEQERQAWVYLAEPFLADFFSMPFSEYVQNLLSFETQPPPHFVRGTTYWAVNGAEIIGRIGIRHELNDFLRMVGGHVGYIVRPSFRRRGVASEMMRQVLDQDLTKRIGHLLLTCDEENLISEKTITKFGGQFENTITYGPSNKRKKRFWIHLNNEVEIQAYSNLPRIPPLGEFYKIVGYTAPLSTADKFVIATLGERIVGAVRLTAEKGVYILRGMFVHPDFQKRGIGKKMLNAFRVLMQENAVRCAYLICGPHLRLFYGSIGFKDMNESAAPGFMRERRKAYVPIYGEQILLRYNSD